MRAKSLSCDSDLGNIVLEYVTFLLKKKGEGFQAGQSNMIRSNSRRFYGTMGDGLQK